jgi:hypothetical protein
MKIFEEYTKEIRKKIIDQWTKDGHNAKNMENDPVINLLLSALSYQAYHIHKNINQYEEKTIREFRDRSIPCHLIKPIPAFSIVETKLKEGCEEKIMDETCSFEFVNSQKQKFAFTPLLNTKIIHAELEFVEKLEENVWKIELRTANPIDNLSGLSFFVDTHESIEIECIKCFNNELPLIKPSQYHQLPFTKWFNNAHLFLEQNYYLFGTYDYWQEIFLTHYTPLFYIGQYDTKKTPLGGQTHIELEITFSKPVSTTNLLKINCIPLVNVDKKEITLDDRNPVKDLTSDTGQFLNLLCEEENKKDIENIFIRQHGVERYNSDQLFEQMQEILYRYNADYYAFQNIRELSATDKLENLQNVIDEIRGVVNKSEEKMIKDHYYAILKKNNNETKKVELKYLTTAGASANGIKEIEKTAKIPIALDINKTNLLLETKSGKNSITDETQKDDIAKYYFQTKDRLVTPADITIFIKTFYYEEDKKLNDEIENISIRHENEYIAVIINLKHDSFLKNSDKAESLAKVLQNKITLRSSGVLPFKVHIENIPPP